MATSTVLSQASAAAPQAYLRSFSAAVSSRFSSRHEGRDGTSRQALSAAMNAAAKVACCTPSATFCRRGAIAPMALSEAMNTTTA
ncbi:hypothetical protein G6F45_013980 [Rhizopus arrhizus]|nr:hypothetical protein G6F31_021483 [Rhizopus arrhizus]KAG1606448.1 hypothetical protein G6F45_013980 [Rhizopus arrhizus]